MSDSVLHRGADQTPPPFEPSFTVGVRSLLELGISEQDGVERRQDLAAVVLGPADRVRVLERPVLRVGAIDGKPDVEAARGQVALRPDIVAGKEVNG